MLFRSLAALPNVQLVLNDGSLYSQEGRIESISGVIDTSTGSVQLRAVFPNPGRLLHSGSSGNVLLPHIYKNVVTVPQVATFELQDKKFVYKVENGVATSQNITVSPQSDGKNFIVTAGLTPGEVIVTEGVGLMREGTPIKPKGAATTATAPAEQPTKEQ